MVHMFYIEFIAHAERRDRQNFTIGIAVMSSPRTRHFQRPHPLGWRVFLYKDVSMKAFKREEQIYDFIREHRAKEGYAPAWCDIGAGVGLSLSSVGRYLNNLKVRGAVDWEPHQPRTIHITGTLD